ncbi:uncharacterized protein LOC106865415 isoform X1 [Brachypodium distachyon]|uniref:uncharacterized protein LOC106865415 isoform X1 n=1 Tax=Brachypodium distachyon TaxID=15368 RepID=UPI000D0E1E64|nr:uncharacterized protein LOC106865415 isoform X1 [Brachypodium distachyon]|eukprot:XP_024314363.1 uncharacterized protein LOC106865415 isoform X1 [Brachypodium distachyon]
MAAYQLKVAQLHPTSLFLLAVFQFLCEGFVGVMPLVALFRHYFYPRIEQTGVMSSGVSFRARDKMKSEFIVQTDKKIEKEWRADWCWVRVDELDKFLHTPTELPANNGSWLDRYGRDAELLPIVKKIKALRLAGLTDLDPKFFLQLHPKFTAMHEFASRTIPSRFLRTRASTPETPRVILSPTLFSSFSPNSTVDFAPSAPEFLAGANLQAHRFCEAATAPVSSSHRQPPHPSPLSLAHCVTRAVLFLELRSAQSPAAACRTSGTRGTTVARCVGRITEFPGRHHPGKQLTCCPASHQPGGASGASENIPAWTPPVKPLAGKGFPGAGSRREGGAKQVEQRRHVGARRASSAQFRQGEE